MEKQTPGLEGKNARIVGQHSLRMCVGGRIILIPGHVFLWLVVLN